jgi:hypothetical protein
VNKAIQKNTTFKFVLKNPGFPKRERNLADGCSLFYTATVKLGDSQRHALMQCLT